MFAPKTNFSKHGLLMGVLLVLTEYILFSLFFSYANPDLWDNQIPHKFYFYITFLLGTLVLVSILLKPTLKNELAENAENFRDFKITVGKLFAFASFGLGTYILYHLLIANIFDDVLIFQFEENNLHVSSASKPFAILNQLLYPVVLAFIYQGFLLNGLSALIGYRKSTLVTSLFYGYWSQNLIGGAVFNLFLNHVFKESKNIFYPILLSIILSVSFTLIYSMKPEIWMLKALASDYNDEFVKGILLSVLALPIVIPTVLKIFKK